MKVVRLTQYVLFLTIIYIFYSYSPMLFAADHIPKGFAPVDVMYHGSTSNNILSFEPRAEQVRDAQEGAKIFATPSIALASCYLFRWDDSWVHQFVSSGDDSAGAKFEVTMVISDYKRFISNDKGGSIYLLPSSSFNFDEDKGLGIYEWTSSQNVVPFTYISFSSALEAMKNFGVKIYFMSKAQFNHYLKLQGEQQIKFLKKLESKISVKE